MYDKLVNMYIEKQGNNHLLYTLLTINQCGAATVFDINKDINQEWPAHLAFLLQNIEFCNKSAFVEFIDILIGKVKDVHFIYNYILDFVCRRFVLAVIDER